MAGLEPLLGGLANDSLAISSSGRAVARRSVDAATRSLLAFFEPDGGRFNYLLAHKRTKAAYQGLDRLGTLTAGTALQKKRVGFNANIEVVSLAAPLAFGRKT